MKKILFIGLLVLCTSAGAQVCDCELEFTYIKNAVEKNSAGFADRINAISKGAYEKQVREFIELTHNKFSSDNCVLIISQYLNLFKSHHLGFRPAFDVYKTDTEFVNRRPLFEISDSKINEIKQSHSWEGIYLFTHDSSYKIAVIKDVSPLHDYVGVILESKISTWKKGMIKFEAKLSNDSLALGLLYIRNHRPKLEGFGLYDDNNMISGDWRREGSLKKEMRRFPSTPPIPPIDSKKLSGKTFYIKIESFDPDLAPAIDSVLRVNKDFLNSTPNLVLDLRDNGGGADFLWQSLVPYLYTSPIKNIGVDVLATESNIAGWSKYLEDKDQSAENLNGIKENIAQMEKDKWHWVNIAEDRVDSSMKPKLFPKKIVILVNRWCGSSTEEFLLLARQSSKVILVGENTIGNLDYSNVVKMPFSCFPYTLSYPTTRSRRLDIKQGIDNIGIAPDRYLKEGSDWIKEAQNILEQE